MKPKRLTSAFPFQSGRKRPLKPFLGMTALLLLWSNVAYASQEGGSSNLVNILYLIGVISVAYLGAHVFADSIEKRFGLVTGVEYILIGIMLGPASPVLRLFNFTAVDASVLIQLSPFLVLGTGAIGLLTGLRFEFRGQNSRPSLIRSTIIAGFTFVAVSVPLYLLALLQTPIDNHHEVLPLVLCASALALVADGGPIRALITYLEAKGDAGDYALGIARTSSSLAVIVFGTLLCIFHDTSLLGEAGVAEGGINWLTSLEWLGIHLVIGTVLGAIFSLFLMRDFEDEKILTVAIGIVIFTSGLAFYLKLSPIFVNFILGVVLNLFSRQSRHVETMLISIEHPLYIALFFFGGAIISFDIAWWGYGLIVGYLLLRWVGRGIGGIFANRFQQSNNPLPPVSAVLWAPGGLSIAMLLNFYDIFSSYIYAKEMYVALLGGIVVSELLAYKYTRRWLIDSTDVSLVDHKPDSKEPGGRWQGPHSGGPHTSTSHNEGVSS